MKTRVKSPMGCETVVENDAETITIRQSEEEFGENDMVMMFDEKFARKLIKAIRKSAKELGWEV